MALTALVPVIGALAFLAWPVFDTPYDLWEVLPDLVLLFITGAFFHVFGFVLNEWADVEVDRASSDLQDKPLVSGDISMREALGTAVVAGALTFVPLALVTRDPFAHLSLLMALLTATGYDLFGKRIPLDVLLAGSLTLLLMAGAIASGEFDPQWQPHMTLFACIAGLQFLQNFYQNAIEGGIKDADHDARAKARTFAAVLGVRIVDGKVETGWAFTNAAIIDKAAHIALMLYTAVEVMEFDSHESGQWLFVMLLGLIFVMVVTTSMMLPPVDFDRPRLKRVFSIHEAAAFAATIVVLTPLFGSSVALAVFLLPFVWFMLVNRLLFGGALEPGV
jgi:4-hydroxybenzoate polyprenyltransferase